MFSNIRGIKKKNKNFTKNFRSKKGIILAKTNLFRVISLACTYSTFYSEHIVSKF